MAELHDVRLFVTWDCRPQCKTIAVRFLCHYTTSDCLLPHFASLLHSVKLLSTAQVKLPWSVLAEELSVMIRPLVLISLLVLSMRRHKYYIMHCYPPTHMPKEEIFVWTDDEARLRWEMGKTFAFSCLSEGREWEFPSIEARNFSKTWPRARQID